jgi:hypothetical protein
LQRALRVFDPKPGRAEVDGDWLLEEERRLRADVEAFAGDFFLIPVAKRRERWDELLSRCPAVSPLRVRLEALKAGLAVEPRTQPSGVRYHGELADHLLESFPLAPVAQAASRQAFLRRIEGDSLEEQGDWERAARYLLDEWPAVGALDREFLVHIANLSGRLQVRRKMHLRNVERPQPAPAPGGEGSSWWVIPVVLVVIGLVRGMMSGNDSSSTKPPFKGYTAPQPPPSASLDELLRATRVRKPVEFPFPIAAGKHPPIQEMLDSSEYDVKVLGSGGSRILCFTPRSGSKEAGAGAAPANNGRPIYFGEATLRLLGFSRDEVNDLFSRAERGKRPDPVGPQGEAERRGPPKSTGSDKTRP